MKGNGLFDLTLIDEGGRLIKVFRVRESCITNLKIGNRVWLFDLATARPMQTGTSWRHPLNFHEIDESDAYKRAWSLKLFVEQL